MSSTIEQQHELDMAHRMGRLEGENRIMKRIIETHLKIKLNDDSLGIFAAEDKL